MNSNPAASQHPARADKPRGWLYRSLAAVLGAAGLVLLSLFFSILLEWGGMVVLWRDQGATHSANLLSTELSYLHRDFKRAVLDSSPAELAVRAAATAYYWAVVRSGLLWLHQVLIAPASPREMSLLTTAKRLYHYGVNYMLAAFSTLQLFAVRLTVVVLSIPAFLFVGLGALVDGLVQRDLRRAGGAIERSRLFHRFRQFLTPLAITPALLYLALPITLHPNVVFLPAVGLFGTALYASAALFKKDL